MDWFTDLLTGYDPGPPLGEGLPDFSGWDYYEPAVYPAPSPIAVRAPAAAPSLAPLAPLASVEPAAYEPLRIRITRPTWFRSDNMDLLDLINNAGPSGSADALLGPLAGPNPPGVPRYEVPDWFLPSGPGAANLGALRTAPPAFNFKLPTLPSAQALLGNLAPAASGLSSWLLYGAIALVVVALVRR